MIVRSNSAARLVALGLAAVARGVNHVSHLPEFDSVIADRCRIVVRHPMRVAVDGELVMLEPPLEFSLRRDALQVVSPPPRDQASPAPR
jgi:diacylglycerol kinase family enzyme